MHIEMISGIPFMTIIIMLLTYQLLTIFFSRKTKVKPNQYIVPFK